METLIREAFVHVEVIGPHVIEGHYDLIGPDDEIILPSVWEYLIEPGWSIRMMMWPFPEPPPGGGRFPPRPPQPGPPPPPGGTPRVRGHQFGPGGPQPPQPGPSRQFRGPPPPPPGWPFTPVNADASSARSRSTKKNTTEKTPPVPPHEFGTRTGPISAEPTGTHAGSTYPKQSLPPTSIPASLPKPSSSSKKKARHQTDSAIKPQSKNSEKSKGQARTAGPSGQQPRDPPHGPNSWLPDDPLNVQQMILSHLTLSSRAPITSVYDLATLISNCCANVFDQNHIPDDFQFLDFFEHSIGAVVGPEFFVSIQR